MDISIRDADFSDLDALTALKPTYALHRDRIENARNFDIEYYVVCGDETVIGFGMLVFKRPPNWPNPDMADDLPTMIDVFIVPELRGQGYGTILIKYIEEQALAAGAARLHLGVDPVDNKGAHALYLNLGYKALKDEPVIEKYDFSDSDGNEHKGEYWMIPMVKEL